jgi:hypothetical protein
MKRPLPYPVFVLPLLLLASSPAHAGSTHVCVVQLKEGNESAQAQGYDAVQLTKELSNRKLADGTPIDATAVPVNNAKEARAETKRLNCDYVVDLVHHGNFGGVAASGPVGDPIQPPPDSDDHIPGTQQLDAIPISYELRQKEGGKSLGGGVGRTINFGPHSVNKVTPYQQIADAITKKLNRLH